MISKYTYKGLTWIDLESPTTEELKHVMEEHSIPPLVAEELHNKGSQSTVNLYPNFIYMVMYFPGIPNHRNTSVEQEINFIIGKNFIITTHYQFIESLNEFSKTFEVDAILDRSVNMDHAGFLFSNLIKTLYAHSRHELSAVNTLLHETEKKIFEGKESKMVISISNINRTLVDFKQALRSHKESLQAFEYAGKKFFGEDFGHNLSGMISEYKRTQDILEGQKEILDTMRNTNDSLLASKNAEAIRILTIVTLLISPLIVVSNIFVINSDFLDLGSSNRYYLVLIFMLIASLLAFLYVKRKKWL